MSTRWPSHSAGSPSACYHEQGARGGRGGASMSFGELLFLAMLALLVFGPRKLPEVARTVARVIAELRRASNEFRYSLEDEIRGIEITERTQKRTEALPEPARVVEGAVPRAPDDPRQPPAPEAAAHPEPAPPPAVS